MEEIEFSKQLATQLASLEPKARIDFGLDIARRLLPDYLNFYQEYQWGNPEVLKRAIDYITYASGDEVDELIVNGLMDELDLIIPDTEEFGDFLTSYAINAACAIWELLEYLIDNDQTHLMHMSSLVTDTIDFKLQEENSELTSAEILNHPQIMAEWNYQLKISL